VSGGNRQSISLFALHIGRRSAVGIADRRRRTHERVFTETCQK
jgi:hypothetical protein